MLVITELHRMRRWLFLLLCTAPCSVRAQDPSLAPDLFRALHGTQSDTARVQTLAKLCFNLTNASPDSALRFGEQARTLAKRIGDPKGLADAHNNLGYLAINQGHLDVAATHLDTALQLFTTIGNPAYLAVVRSNKGWLAERRSDRVGMLREFQEALKLSELAKDTGNIAVVLYNIGTTYNKMEEFDRARAMLEQAYALERTLGRPDKEANCLLGIGNTHRSQGDVEKAMRYYQLAGPLYQRIGDRVGAGLVEENIGGLYEVTDPARALVHYRSAFTQYRSINSGGDMAYSLLAIGSMQKALGLFDKADSSFTAGAALAAAHSGMELLMDYEKQRAELASARGDSKGTLQHYERYVELKDSLRSTGTENELMRLRTAFETERAEKDNELLRIADKEKTERLRARNLQLYGSLLLAALALVGVLLVWRNLRQKRKHADVLEKLNAELNEQQARIEEINGLLKLKVLRTQMDPHFIHNCLNAIRALSLKGDHERAEEYLEGFARILRNVLEHSVRDRIGLDEEIAFLNDYVRLEQLRLGDDLTWSISADEALLDEEPQVPSLLVQPFVENAIWHGLAPKQGPKRLEVHFFQVDGVVTCRVQDNGVGRTQKAPTPGRTSLGLKLTGERLELLTERMRSQGGFRVEDLKDAEGAPSGTLVEMRFAG